MTQSAAKISVASARMPSLYDCAGVSVALHSHSARISGVLGSFLQSASGSSSAADPSLHLHVDVDDDLPARRRELVERSRLLDEIDAHGFARCRYQGDSALAFTYELDRGVACFAPQRALLQIWTDDEQRAVSARFANLVVADLLRFALPFYGVALLHASCVVVDGRGVLVCGPSGAGKTLLALSLMEHGARLVADDTLALRETAAGIQCFATPEWMGVTPASLPLFPHLRGQIEQGSESVDAYFEKRLFRPELLFPNVRCSIVAPAVLLEVAQAQTSTTHQLPRVREIPAREAFLNLVRENYVPFHRYSLPRFARHDVRIAGLLVDAVRAYQLSMSADGLAQAVALLHQATQAVGSGSNSRSRRTDSR